MPPAADEVIKAFESIRTATPKGVRSPHKPLLVLLALARIQAGLPRLMPLASIEERLRLLLMEFGPSNSSESRHLPFWHLQSDRDGELWELTKTPKLVARPLGSTPNITDLRDDAVQGGFAPAIQAALEANPALLQAVAARILDKYFPATLHDDIRAGVGLSLDVEAAATPAGAPSTRSRDPAFREKVLRAYEYRCCVCGFDLRVNHMPAGLEAAHIHWYTAGGPDIESNGLCLCSLHHKLFDLGAFSIEATEHRIVFSSLAISGERGLTGVLAHHGQRMLAPQHPSLRPAPEFLDWNWRNVFKTPSRSYSSQ